jgi:hypothetical protein
MKQEVGLKKSLMTSLKLDKQGNKMWVAITKDGDILAQHSDMKTGYQYVYTIAFQEKIWFNIIWRD